MPPQYGWIIHSLSNYEGSSSNNFTNCSDGVQWVWVLMADCVHDWRGQASAVLGLLSMLLWMIVGIPQMVKNCRNLNGVAGVSFFLLAQWFAGDVTNLVGSILTHQLQIQVYVAIYYVAADVALLVQYVAYLCHKRKHTGNQDGENLVQPVLCVSGLFMFSSLAFFKNILPHSVTTGSYISNFAVTHHASGRNLLASNVGMKVFYSKVDETGYAIGVVSSLLYIGSRLAQIIRNYKLKSTEGLSKVMFVLAVFGNLAYGLAIIVHSVDGIFLIRHLPWIVGSLGVIFLDVTILIQFHYYEQRNFDSLSRAPLVVDQVINVDPTSFN
ncbi:lysosomal amino acid transporter 1 homolog [Haliotis cracherodii]|uniref:lysosomal amino acid transporter 1 homolog n=1 Tax=Haliotis cracherodii TaxID=6455 RepID=UPI0039EA541C